MLAARSMHSNFDTYPCIYYILTSSRVSRPSEGMIYCCLRRFINKFIEVLYLLILLHTLFVDYSCDLVVLSVLCHIRWGHLNFISVHTTISLSALINDGRVMGLEVVRRR